MATTITIAIRIADDGHVDTEVLDHIRDVPPPEPEPGPIEGQGTIDDEEGRLNEVKPDEQDAIQFALAIDDKRIEGSGSGEAAKLRAELPEELRYFGRVEDLGRNGARIPSNVRELVHAEAGTFRESWPALLLVRESGEEIFVVPVARDPKNDKAGREWRVAWAAYRMHAAMEKFVKGRVLYVFKDRTAVFLADLKVGLNMVETDRGNNAHIAIASNQASLEEVLG